MKNLFSFLAYAFTALAIVFSLMPMDTIAFLPIGIAIAFSLVWLRKSEGKQKKASQIVLTICVLCSIYVLGKTFLIKDEVAKDTKFEKEKIENKQESKKELEELEGLE
jgi:hypothetical protein